MVQEAVQYSYVDKGVHHKSNSVVLSLMWGKKEPPSVNAGEMIRKDENNGKGEPRKAE